MTSRNFDAGMFTSQEDWDLALSYVEAPRRPGKGVWEADLVLAPDGKPYLYRWHLVPRNPHGNVYFHIQVASDPERPLHDHPWDNSSVILAGAYHEQRFVEGPGRGFFTALWQKGDVIYREAELAHRLILPEGVPYTMTLFTTGRKRCEWGFWYPHGWVHNKRVVRTKDGISIHEELCPSAIDMAGC